MEKNMRDKKSFFLKLIKSETFKSLFVIAFALIFTWGIVKATENNIESATNNFSVIGRVSSITDESISVIDAKGSDTEDEKLYDLDITYLNIVETKDYIPLIISDIKVGDMIIAQGLTNGTDFFIKRIISFSDMPIPVQEELQKNSTTTQDNVQVDVLDSNNIATSSVLEVLDEVIISSTTVSATTSDESQSIMLDLEKSTSSNESNVIETFSDIIDDGIDHASDIIDVMIDSVINADISNTEATDVLHPPN